MGNHDNRLIKFTACTFQQPQYIRAGMAVKISCRHCSISTTQKKPRKACLESVLKEKPGEWGTFEIVKDMKYTLQSMTDDCEYKKGEITRNFKRKETEEKEIEEIKANGGWSLMTYYIKTK